MYQVKRMNECLFYLEINVSRIDGEDLFKNIIYILLLEIP